LVFLNNLARFENAATFAGGFEKEGKHAGAKKS
jgi:hypothetical protein